MKATLFTAAAALLVASVSAIPVADMAYVTQPNNQEPPKPDCDDTPAKDLPCGAIKTEVYIVKKGDILTNIAKQFKSGICDIAKYNNIANPDNIQPDQKLTIPAMCTTKPDNDSCANRIQPINTTNTCVRGVTPNPPVYFVLPQDTMTKIANNFDITLDSLVAANRQIRDVNNLAINQTINVPVCQGFSCTDRPYTVQSGESFSIIAGRAGITVGQIETSNPRQIPEQLQAGQVIGVPLCSGVA